jgi:hypothetical protein
MGSSKSRRVKLGHLVAKCTEVNAPTGRIDAYTLHAVFITLGLHADCQDGCNRLQTTVAHAALATQVLQNSA